MARIRTIKPEFFDDEELCALPYQHRLGFIGLWTQADRDGRFKDQPSRLKARIFPFDDVDMNAILTDLARAGFIIRYVVDGKQYACVKPSGWREHQRPRDDEAQSKLPSVDTATVFVASESSDESVPSQVLGKERKGDRKGTEESVELGSSPTVLSFPVVGRDAKEWHLTEAQVRDWQGSFPNLDVMAEARKAQAWLRGNPNRRKTSRGMTSFFVRWLTRATDSGRGPMTATQSPRVAEQAPQRAEVLNELGEDWFTECRRLHGGRCNGRYGHSIQMGIDEERAKAAS